MTHTKEQLYQWKLEAVEERDILSLRVIALISALEEAREALKRLGSSETMTIPFMLNNKSADGQELTA